MLNLRKNCYKKIVWRKFYIDLKINVVVNLRTTFTGQEEMMKELRRPTPETLMLQRDLEKAKESLRQEQTLGNAAKQQLEKRLQEEVGS